MVRVIVLSSRDGCSGGFGQPFAVGEDVVCPRASLIFLADHLSTEVDVLRPHGAIVFPYAITVCVIGVIGSGGVVTLASLGVIEVIRVGAGGTRKLQDISG